MSAVGSLPLLGALLAGCAATKGATPEPAAAATEATVVDVAVFDGQWAILDVVEETVSQEGAPDEVRVRTHVDLPAIVVEDGTLSVLKDDGSLSPFALVWSVDAEHVQYRRLCCSDHEGEQPYAFRVDSVSDDRVVFSQVRVSQHEAYDPAQADGPLPRGSSRPAYALTEHRTVSLARVSAEDDGER